MSDHAVVQDTPATRFLGVVFACLIVLALVAAHKVLGWHYGACGAICGALAALIGASGTSVNGPIQASIFGWAGATLLVFALMIFTGVLNP